MDGIADFQETKLHRITLGLFVEIKEKFIYGLELF